MKKICVMIFCAFLIIGGLTICPGNPPGISVTHQESGMVLGGCYTTNANAPYESVCSDACGGTILVRPRVSYASGNSAAGVMCKSNVYCTYGGTSDTKCSGE